MVSEAASRRDLELTSLPAAWNEWALPMPERVLDLLDITTLRHAKMGIDASFKSRVWELSQNGERLQRTWSRSHELTHTSQSIATLRRLGQAPAVV